MGIERTLRLIVTYKLIRAALSVLGSLALLVLFAAGFDGRAQVFVETVRDHATSGVSLSVSKLVLSALEPTHFKVVIAALFLDGVVVFIEGWALLRGWWWGPWLVIGASSVLLPFEVFELARVVSAPRLLVLVVNLAIVGWLLRRQWRARRAARQGP